jgi:hypothetical protein
VGSAAASGKKKVAVKKVALKDIASPLIADFNAVPGFAWALTRQLALFAPENSPMLLVRAKAAGLTGHALGGGLHSLQNRSSAPTITT